MYTPHLCHYKNVLVAKLIFIYSAMYYGPVIAPLWYRA